MLFVATVVRNLNPPTIASKWKILLATSKNFSSSTGYSPEELEKFRKVFRTMPSYEESISSKDFPHFLKSINIIKPQKTYEQYIKYSDKILGGRYELTQSIKYLQVKDEPHLLMNECLLNFDLDNDGFISKEEFEYCMEAVRVHEPRIKNISYETFLEEADINKDGKISVSECRDWLNKNLALA